MQSFNDHTSGRYNLSRLAGFSDCVISIAITILVLGLEVPSVHAVNERGLVAFLYDSIHPAIGYILSFLLIGMYWIGHYTAFHYLTHATQTLVALNGLFLLCISFLPFPTGLHAAYPDDKMAMVLYGVAQLLCGISLLSLWLYASGSHRLIDRATPTDNIRNMTRRLMIAPLLSLVATGCIYISIPLSKFIFGTIPMLYVFYPLAIAARQDNQGTQAEGAEG